MNILPGAARTASPRPPAAQPPGPTAQASDAATGLLFIGFLVLMFVEYLGLPNELPILKVTRFSTLLSVILVGVTLQRVGSAEFFQFAQTRIQLTLIGLTIISFLYAYIKIYALQSITPHLGYFGLTILGFYLVRSHVRAERLSLVMTVVSVVLILRNLDLLTSDLRIGHFKAGYFMGDGNDFAWGILTMVPCSAYLLLKGSGLLKRLVGGVGLAIGLFAIIGTQSRGATLALAAAGLYYLLFVTRRRALGFGAIAGAALVVLALAPAAYFDRMKTLGNYEEDGSAMGRIVAWGAATQMALDHPLGVGAGNFNSVYGRFYRPAEARAKWVSAHSVYFKILAEYGFLGVALFLFQVLANVRDNHRARKKLTKDSPFEPVWAGLLNMAVLSYAVAGIFLGGFMYPHLYFLTGLTLAARHVAEHAAATVGATAPATAPRVPAARAVTLAPRGASPRGAVAQTRALTRRRGVVS